MSVSKIKYIFDTELQNVFTWSLFIFISFIVKHYRDKVVLCEISPGHKEFTFFGGLTILGVQKSHFRLPLL